MQRRFTLLVLLFSAVMLAGCSLLPTGTSLTEKLRPVEVTDLFNYAGQDYHSDQVLVRAVQGVDLPGLVEGYGSRVVNSWEEINWSVVTVPEGISVLAFIAMLSQEQGILLVEPDFRYRAAGNASAQSQYPKQWALQQINAEAAWQVTTGDSNVLICIMDTGVQMDHPGFSGKTFIAPYDATGETPDDVTDRSGHGTHVAGIAGADGRTSQVAGIAWDCPIMPVRVANSNGEVWNSFLTGGLLYVVEFLQANPGYRAVVNLSMCSSGYSFALKDAIDYAFAAGVLLVAPAGDTGKRNPDSFPGAYNGVLTVAASTPYETRADFSTIGEFNSVAAPGVLIWSMDAGNSYTYLQGTSMSAAYVTGAVALLLSTDDSLTPLELKNQVEQTARGDGFTGELGYGILDIAALLGPKKVLQYGSLEVKTNIIPAAAAGISDVGVITVFDEAGKLISYGTTGETGRHVFHALKPGNYRISVTYHDQFSGSYTTVEQSVQIVAAEKEQLHLTLPVPVSVTRTLEAGYPLLVDLKYSESYPATDFLVTITAEGCYGFETSSLNGSECDTILYVYDSLGNLVAANDNYPGSSFSSAMLSLVPDTYIVILEESGLDEDLCCKFSVYSIVVTY